MPVDIRRSAERYRSGLARLREKSLESWISNDLPDPAVIAPQIAASGKAHLFGDKLEPACVDFLTSCANYPLWPLSEDQTFRVLSLGEVARLRDKFPNVVTMWNSGPGTARVFKVCDGETEAEIELNLVELDEAIVLAAGSFKSDPLLVWFPITRRYVYLSSRYNWLAFSSPEAAFDRLLVECLSGLEAAIQ